MGVAANNVPSVDVRYALQCPYCKHSFSLTWQRYFAGPYGAQKCPACDRTSKLKRPVASWLLTPLCGIIAAIPFIALLVTLFLQTGEIAISPIAMLCSCIGCMLIVVPMDRWLDARTGRLVPVEGVGSERIAVGPVSATPAPGNEKPWYWYRNSGRD